MTKDVGSGITVAVVGERIWEWGRIIRKKRGQVRIIFKKTRQKLCSSSMFQKKSSMFQKKNNQPNFVIYKKSISV